MELFFSGHTYQYAVEQIMLMLFPGERPVYPERPSGALRACVRLCEGEVWVTATTEIVSEGRRFAGMARVRRDALTGPLIAERLRQRAVKLSFYRAAVRMQGRKPVWGSLSGIRPALLLRRLMDEGLDDKAACRRFTELYDVSGERAALALDAARAARSVEQAIDPRRDVCLYLGVPFCPTRCAYCSFVSQSVEKSMKLIPAFTEVVQRDIRATAEIVRENGLNVVAVYFGGGTPTTLSPAELETVLGMMERSFDLRACRELTVEAGRPDTITREKLEVLRAHGVTRVSVNPQTMSDRVLEAIGRKHTAADVLRALETVRAVGGFQVNMDLIAGLPEDDPAGFENTLRTVLSLGAENVTVHTLALKKGSRILLEGTRLPDAAEVGEMLDAARALLRDAGYAPYYLYRQKFMSGGFENVGWCRPGTEDLYNICIMEELCSILSMGAGASTKLTVGDGRIRRIFAPKYAREYIDGIEKVCADKQTITEFFQGAKQ